MDKGFVSRHVAVLALGIVVVGVLIAAFVPSLTPGYDTSFTLAWGRDLAHRLPLDYTHPSTPTPHPLALIAGLIAGFVPVGSSISAATGLSVAAGLTVLVLVGYVTFNVTKSRIAVAAALTCVAVSAPIGLLVLNVSSDVSYVALALGAVLLTLRGRPTLAVAMFMVAALLRPEAALLALVPLVQSFLARREPDRPDPTLNVTARGKTTSPSAWVRTIWVFTGALTLAAGAWLTTGTAGGDPLIALHSAHTNAQVNDNPRGLIVALTHALPGLAGPTSWLIVAAAATALIVALWARRTRMLVARRSAHTRKPRAHQPPPVARATADNAQDRATITIGIFIGLALVAYLAQGLIGTPLVARYLLLPALLCVVLAARCIPLAGRLARSKQASSFVAVVVAVVLVASSAAANIPGWKDVTYAQQVRTKAFTAATALLSSDLAQNCTAPVVVRSPAVVALTALTLERPLSDIVVADQAGTGVLLQPLTRDAAQLAGYGPLTPLDRQAVFPTGIPPRQSNDHWALYSNCQP